MYFGSRTAAAFGWRRYSFRTESISQIRRRLETLLSNCLIIKMLLEEEVRFLKDQIYGRSSEKLPGVGVSPDQKMLFNEAEVLAAIEAAEAAEAQRATTVAAHERQKRPHSGGREAIPAHLPRVEILHDLPPQHAEIIRLGHELIERNDDERSRFYGPDCLALGAQLLVEARATNSFSLLRKRLRERLANTTDSGPTRSTLRTLLNQMDIWAPESAPDQREQR